VQLENIDLRTIAQTDNKILAQQAALTLAITA
jgi:hypothetical protein